MFVYGRMGCFRFFGGYKLIWQIFDYIVLMPLLSVLVAQYAAPHLQLNRIGFEYRMCY